MLDFTTLRRTGRPNDFLMAPTRFAAVAPDLESPGFDCDVLALRDAVLSIIDDEPRTMMQERSADGLKIEAVQRSAILRFPDRISIEVITRYDGKATIAIYSRAVYGYSDFGVNQKRVRRYLALLRDRLDATREWRPV